jgi:hypothetical protein
MDSALCVLGARFIGSLQKGNMSPDVRTTCFYLVDLEMLGYLGMIIVRLGAVTAYLSTVSSLSWKDLAKLQEKGLYQERRYWNGDPNWTHPKHGAVVTPI